MCFDTIDPESGTIHTLTLLFHFLNKKDILNSNTFLGNYCCIINQILSSSNKRQYLALLKSKPKNKQSEKKSNEVCIMLLFDPGLPYTCRVLRIHTKTRLTPKKKNPLFHTFYLQHVTTACLIRRRCGATRKFTNGFEPTQHTTRSCPMLLADKSEREKSTRTCGTETVGANYGGFLTRNDRKKEKRVARNKLQFIRAAQTPYCFARRTL